MKKILLFVVLLAAAQAQSQNTELVDYLLELHELTGSYYDFMTLVFQETRDLLSMHLKNLSDSGLHEITEGLRVILALQSETQSVVDSANGEQLCVETATTSWEQAINDSGRAISMCADQSFSPINNATDDFHAFVVEQARLAFQVQNVLLNGLSEVNMMTDEDQIRSNVAEQTDDMYTWFNYDVIPSLFRQLDQFLKLEQTLPEEIRECVNAATSRLEDEAQVLRNTLDFC